MSLVKPRHRPHDQPDPTHRVLLVVRGSPSWARVIRMRDWLRTHPDTAVRFEESKVAQWRNRQGDLASYQTQKALFFSHLEDQMDAAERAE